MILFRLSIAALVLAALAVADDGPLLREGKQQIEDYIVRVARQQTDRVAAELATKARWEKMRAVRRKEMLDMLGLEPMPERTPLNARITGVIDRGDYVIEKIGFESNPKLYASANL